MEKTQVTVEYENDRPKRIKTILISNQYEKGTDVKVMKKDIIEKVIKTTISQEYLDKNTNTYIKPTGSFIIGELLGNTGLTGKNYCGYLWGIF